MLSNAIETALEQASATDIENCSLIAAIALDNDENRYKHFAPLVVIANSPRLEFET